MRPSPLSLSLVLAICAHAALASAFYAVAHRPTEARDAQPPVELIDLVEELPPPRDPVAPVAPQLPPTDTAPRAPARSSPSVERAAAAEAEGNVVPELAPPADSAQHAPAPSGSAVDLGIGNYWKSIALTAPSAVPSAEPPPAPRWPRLPSAMDLVHDELRAGDQERGLGASGPLVSAAHEAASPSIAPDVGEALLDVVTDSEGKVVDVSVAGASGERSVWSDFAHEVARQMGSKRLKVPPGARGVHTRIRVRAARVLPSGGSPSVSAGVVDPEGCTGDQGLSRKCFDGPIRQVGGRFDLSDVGAKPRRVVHVRVEEESPL